MTINDILNLYNTVNEKLYTASVAEAFFLIRKMIKEINDWGMSVEMDEYSSTYQQMLSYKLLTPQQIGASQSTIYNQLIFNLFILTMRAKDAFLLRHSNQLEYEGQRLLATNPNFFFNDIVTGFDKITPMLEALHKASKNDIGDTEFSNTDYWNDLMTEYQKALSPLFTNILLRNTLSDEELDIIKNIINSDDVLSDARCIAISALTISVLRFFDAKKVNIILSFAEHDNNMLRQRALVGIVLIIAKYGYMIEYEEHIKNRITFLCKNEDLVKELSTIVFQIVRTTETGKLSKQISEEIMPELIKISPIIQDNLEDMNFDEDSEKIKPRIENILDRIDFSDKINDFTELQMSGSDVFAGTFANMKNFPFFGFIENWLLPFDKKNPYVRRLFDQKASLAESITTNPMMCNSDKFSFSLNMLQLPDNQLTAVEFAMKEEKEQLDEMIKEMRQTNKLSDIQQISNHYILDLYRFYTYFPRHNDFENPLTNVLNLFKSKMFDAIFASTDDKRKIADYYYQYNHYHQAIEVYKQILDAPEQDFETYRNIAYSYQQVGDYVNAVNYYIIAEGLDGNKIWYLRRLAFCYRQLGEIHKAVDCYEKILDNNKEDFKVMFRQAICYIELRQYDDALSLLYKINYLKPDYPRIKFVLTLCLLYCGKIEQASQLSKSNEEQFTEIRDFVLAGHIALVEKNRQVALEHYKKAIAMAKDLKGFLEEYYRDIDILFRNGVTKDTIELVLEVVLIDKFR